MELRLEKGSIKATRQKVQDMLGIPMGSRKLEEMEQRPFNDPFIKEWENQFKHVKKPTPAAIASVISDSTQADFMFQMNFITLFGSTMGTLDNGGRVSTKLLKGITEDVDISEIDWCGYILDCLKNSKKNWKDVKTRKNFYYGPLTFLCLLYLDSTIFPDLRVLRHRPALRSWNTTTMRKRIKMETETRRLGKLEHHGEFNHEEEQDGINVYKGLDVYVPLINDKEPETKEEYYEKIVLKFDIISDERSELVKTLRNGVKKFEDDQMMIDFCKEYRELFNDNEFKHYEYSKDDDSEGETDGDNEDNNHDDDGAPTADTNKKKESENQTKERNKEDIDKQTEESGSEGTDESGSEGTEKNGSEATEGGSDGKEENMNRDEKEVTAKLDVDRETGITIKLKMLRLTTSEKQADDKDEIGEDEFWNTQFTDSQCEELENQAIEEIKKKTTKRKTVIEMTPPSFSLGLSPDTTNVDERDSKKKSKKPSRIFVSPYITKTATKGKSSTVEMLICCYLFSMEGKTHLKRKEGNATIVDLYADFSPIIKIESNVIDIYCLDFKPMSNGVNTQTKENKAFLSHGDDCKYFKPLKTRDMFNWKMEDGKKYDEKKQYKAFSDTMKNEFKKDNEVKKLKDLEMKNMFSMYLKEVQHPKAKEVLNKKPTILRPKWGTKENNTDCGVFLMMHMENYSGECKELGPGISYRGTRK
ncbi:hypothetical protein Tco_1493292 [Tanacetum coccineum]